MLKAQATTTGDKVNYTFFCGANVKVLDPLAAQPKVKKQKQLMIYEALKLNSTAATVASKVQEPYKSIASAKTNTISNFQYFQD